MFYQIVRWYLLYLLVPPSQSQPRECSLLRPFTNDFCQSVFSRLSFFLWRSRALVAARRRLEQNSLLHAGRLLLSYIVLYRLVQASASRMAPISITFTFFSLSLETYKRKLRKKAIVTVPVADLALCVPQVYVGPIL